MFTLESLRKRAEGFGNVISSNSLFISLNYFVYDNFTAVSDCSKSYNDVLPNFRCIHNDSPPAHEINCPLLSCAFARKSNFGHVLASTCDDGRLIVLNTEFKRNDGYPYHSKLLLISNKNKIHCKC